jgi:polyisoprenoid-binding protein YceI
MKKKMNFALIVMVGIFAVVSCAPRGDRTAEMLEKIEIGEIPEEVSRYTLQPAQSEVAWAGQNITGSGHNGTIGVKGGELYVYDGVILGGQMEIDMTSIVVLDIEDPGSNARLKGHLESDDFFSVADHPVAMLDIATIEPIEGAAAGAPNYRVTGNLTIKSITHGISFDAYIDQGDDTIQATAEFAFDRSMYDVRFRSGKFFDDLGDNLILDDIQLNVNISAAL